MGSRGCMNEACRTTTSSVWKKGWGLKSGGVANLCFKCGFAYENFVFCETFHSEESGWRECKLCRKLVHCGCVASKGLYEYMDFGGIACKSCSKRSVQPIQIPSNTPNGTFATNGIMDVHPILVKNRIDGDKFSEERLVQLTEATPVTGAASALELHKQTDPVFKTGESSKCLSNLSQQCSLLPAVVKAENSNPEQVVRNVCEPVPVTDAASALELHKQTDPVFKTGESSKCLPNLSQQCSLSPAVVKAENSNPEQVIRNVCEPVPVTDAVSAFELHRRTDPVLKTGESSKSLPNLSQQCSLWPAVVKAENSNPEQVVRNVCEPVPVTDAASALELHKQTEPVLKTGEGSMCLPNLSQQCSSSPAVVKAENSKPKQVVRNMCEPLPQPSLKFSLTTPLGSSSNVPHLPSGIVKRNEQNKSSIQHGQKIRSNYLKPPKPSPVAGLETSKGYGSQTRVARPPAEGRGRNQLLPRYWPRITDQELQQLSGDLKSNIVPLFEKFLSASDAGRIGRLVLPKACAEAYFPSINQSEGIPIRILDIKGKEWTFQFRFWPNNNSRMYVLEGVTPCITSLQLQAGDTVIFCRRDPGGQLVIGGRKASLVEVEDSPEDGNLSVGTDNLLMNGGTASDNSLQQRTPLPEKKKARNIKNQRLHMHNDDAMELRITWEEAQECLYPAASAEPTIVMVDGYAFEEFEEPPIIGNRTFFVSRPSGEQEQLSQCDKCAKWRNLPAHLLSSPWTCSDNVWDSKRCSCSAPAEINTRDLEAYSIVKCSKKQKIADGKLPEEGEPSGLDALATAAVLGDNMPDFVESSSGVTTRHPRHRPGCTCIVCIQPPSGKGKHEPTCKCNVCLMVKRRFRTLMMRKKKRQSERETVFTQTKEGDNRLLNMSNSWNGTGSDIDAGLTPEEHKIDLKSEGIDVAGNAGNETKQMESDGSSQGQAMAAVNPSEQKSGVPDMGESQPSGVVERNDHATDVETEKDLREV